MADSGTSGTFHPPISSNMLPMWWCACTTFYLFVSSQGGVSLDDVGKGGWFLHYLFPPIRKGTVHQVRYNCAICCLLFSSFCMNLMCRSHDSMSSPTSISGTSGACGNCLGSTLFFFGFGSSFSCTSLFVLKALLGFEFLKYFILCFRSFHNVALQ